MKNLKTIQWFTFILLMFISNSSRGQSNEDTLFPNGPFYYYEKDGLEIKGFKSCGTYIYGPEACYRIRNKNNYAVIFRVKFKLKGGGWKNGVERRIEAGQIQDFREIYSCLACPGVGDIMIYYVQ